MTIQVRTKVQMGGISEGDPPMLFYHKIATRSDGKQRPFSQAVQVTDAALLARLRREVQNGDECEVVVEQHLGKTLTSVLLDFTRVETAVSVGASGRR